MSFRLILAACALLWAHAAWAPAWAQNSVPCSWAYTACTRGLINVSPPSAMSDGTLGPASYDANGAARTHPQDGAGNDVSASHPLPVAVRTSAAYSTPGCTVGTSSGLCVASGAAANHITVQNVSVSAQIACAWGGAAALNNNGSFLLQAGQSATWGANTGGVPPASALNCIASAASSPLYVEIN